jgi:hypothetical protein
MNVLIRNADQKYLVKTENLKPGVYFIMFQIGTEIIFKKWIKV